MTQSRYLKPSVELTLVFLAGVIVLAFLGDRNGYEGDDLNIIIPMLSLPDALLNDLTLYKYGWQPLAYWVGWGVFQLFGTVTPIFLLSPIAIAAGLTILYGVLVFRFALPRLLFIPLVFLTPEVIYTGLYFNSTALGYPFAMMAVGLAFLGRSRVAAAATGVLLAIAVLFRLDFVLVAPAIWLLRVFQTRDLIDSVIVVLSGLACLAVALVLGVLDIPGIFEIYSESREEIVARAGVPGWGARTKVFVATTIFSPLGWCALVGLGAYLIAQRQRVPWLAIFAALLSLAPFFYTMLNLLTPKYVIPVLALYSMIVGIVCVDLLKRLRGPLKMAFQTIWIALTLLLIFVAIEPDNKAPYLRMTASDARQIGTHDGSRSWGAYLPQFRSVAKTSLFSAKEESAHQLMVWAETDNRGDLWIAGEASVFADGGMGWRHLYLLAKQLGYEAERIDRMTTRLSIGATTIYLTTDIENVPPGACSWDLMTNNELPQYNPPSCLQRDGFSGANT